MLNIPHCLPHLKVRHDTKASQVHKSGLNKLDKMVVVFKRQPQGEEEAQQSNYTDSLKSQVKLQYVS